MSKICLTHCPSQSRWNAGFWPPSLFDYIDVLLFHWPTAFQLYRVHTQRRSTQYTIGPIESNAVCSMTRVPIECVRNGSVD